MLNIFKKKVKKVSLVAPVSGETVELSKVPDKVFASGMMGKGIAFNFDSNEIAAPCDGKITMIPDSLHAFGITADNGAEILIHIGLDTVNLKGEGFTKLVEVGSHVKAGKPIIKVDHEAILAKGYNLVTMLLVTNSDDYTVEIKKVDKVEAGQSEVVTVEK
ncbi:PTS sugar transporter subunit IIA [Pediococcus ethanolidurans]|uniref:PTS system IIA component, Glc family (TC 4.A.1) n=1 Tax=Pediococcus ethanolidurans TaxID=319653 RepID=A0A1H9KRE5_9LACO|nr:PTS glucose transporter subunit IIA [Pediococcus ethanolidurans]GEN94005.1 PTS glucose transporter subunit IIA [Pediococcus ethanolidurans]SER01475.1 PTS system IIA component, Glc family (TC 4.A.1) [Pediococcus ethanolidurans]